MLLHPQTFKLCKHGCLISFCFIIGATIAPLAGIIASTQSKCSRLPWLEAIVCSFSQAFAMINNPLLVIDDAEKGFGLIVAGVPGALSWFYSQYGLVFLLVGGIVLLGLLKILL
jgi:hypothetical protein